MFCINSVYYVYCFSSDTPDKTPVSESFSPILPLLSEYTAMLNLPGILLK